MERERFDGADIMHLIRARSDNVDWDRLMARFGPHWRVLLGHLVVFGYVYPSEQAKVPSRVLQQLVSRLAEDHADSNEKICQGPYISRQQYLIDIGHWGYADARLQPRGPMSRGDIDRWTAAAFEHR